MSEKIAATLRTATGQVTLEVEKYQGHTVWVELEIEGEAQAPTVSSNVLNVAEF